MNYVGIDISKDSFVAAFSAEKGSKTKSYHNTPEGVRKFIKNLDKEQPISLSKKGGQWTSGINNFVDSCCFGQKKFVLYFFLLYICGVKL